MPSDFLIPPLAEKDIQRFTSIQDLLSSPYTLVDHQGKETILPPSLCELLRRGSQIMLQGKALYLDAVDRMLTTQEAGTFLNISRTFLIKLLDHNEIPFSMVGSHRRICLKDLIDYKRKQDLEGRIGLERDGDEDSFQRLLGRTEGLATYVMSIGDDMRRLMFLSSRIENMVGYSSSELMNDPDFFLTLIPQEDRALFFEAIRHCLLSHDSLQIDFRVNHRDGRVRWLHSKASLVADGSNFLLQGILIDITERIEVEEALREGEGKLRGIIGHCNDGIALTDEKGHIVEWSPSQERITGVGKAAVLGKPLFEIFRDYLKRDEESVAYIRTEVENILQHGKSPLLSAHHEAHFTHSGDEKEPCEIRFFPIRTASGFVIGLIYRDIGERKKVEEALMRSRDFYLTLFEDFPALVWRSGKDAKFDYFNRTWLDYTGRTMEQELGDGWIEGVHPEDLDRCLSTYMKAFYFQQPFEMDYRRHRHDGEYRWIRDIARPFQDLEGEFAGYIGSCYELAGGDGVSPPVISSREPSSI